jgi:hypothetical protein
MLLQGMHYHAVGNCNGEVSKFCGIVSDGFLPHVQIVWNENAGFGFML